MKRILCLSLFLLSTFSLLAQKKPLDHTVYDSWQSIGERMISNDGKWVVYTITPQEGDADLFIQSTENLANKRQVPRGYNAVITEDNRFVVFRIKPLYKETREARIKKKKAEDMPKDSVGIVELGKEGVLKVAKVRGYKTPERGVGWMAYHKEREAPLPTKGGPAGAQGTQKAIDSLKMKVDSLTQLVIELKNIKGGSRDEEDADEEPGAAAPADAGSDLVLRNLLTGKDRTFKNVSDYAFNKYGQKLVLKLSKAPRDSNSKAAVAVFDLKTERLDTILKGGNDFRGFAFTEDGSKLAFVAERDTSKALQKFYSLYLYNGDATEAQPVVHKGTVGMEAGNTVSENGTITFSKSGKRLLFGVAPIQPPKDTSLVDIDLVKLDVWHYKDDYLQTQQLFNLQNELKRSYLTAYDFESGKIVPLGSPGLPTVVQTMDGDGQYFLGVTDTGRRVTAQWLGGGNVPRDVYAVNPSTGERVLVKKNHQGSFYPSSTGKYILLYDAKKRHYFLWDGKALNNISMKIKYPLYDEEHDTPEEPNAYGVMGWHEGDSAVYVYDKYDVWKLDITNKKLPVNLTKDGRKEKISYRYLRALQEERNVRLGQSIFFRRFNQTTKNIHLIERRLVTNGLTYATGGGMINVRYAMNNFVKARDSNTYILTWENFESSPALYVTKHNGYPNNTELHFSESLLHLTNPQQSTYNWGTAELFKWTAFNGKTHEGVLYKPENFDSTKKYPLLMYFYERHSADLHNYIAPSPTPSRLNIPFYVSRGYVVFSPDIIYTKGHPAKDAYNSVVSAAQALSKKRWIDSKNIGIQGQSWGGIQVAQLITMTPMFKAAWAGAPVANMFSAYGGIRWEGGVTRQFQYETGQSRIGATLWEKPELYVENSPLFGVPKIKTPLVIMANDADGAVPWYQGIELFTAMRRLGKQVWMLNYNGEAHNLVERKNRKDIQVRQQQYFDWLLKGEAPAKWITDGLPATKKGKEWGL